MEMRIRIAHRIFLQMGIHNRNTIICSGKRCNWTGYNKYTIWHKINFIFKEISFKQLELSEYNSIVNENRKNNYVSENRVKNKNWIITEDKGMDRLNELKPLTDLDRIKIKIANALRIPYD